MTSLQLRHFRTLIRGGTPTEAAAIASGLSIGEARLTVAEDVRNPPPAEAYEPLVTPEPTLIGHNGGLTMDEPSGELRGYLERVERLREEQKGIGDDIRDIMAEAKSRGFDMLAFREMLRLRKMDADKRRDFQNAVDVYGTQLGLL